MDFDKLSVFFAKVGFPTTIAVWFMWKIQVYLDTLTAQQATIIQMLQRLIDLRH